MSGLLEISALRGARIEDVCILEMALVEAGPDGLPIFRHHLAPFIQAVRIELHLADGRLVEVGDYQTPRGEFPLGAWLTDESGRASASPLLEHPIYRLAPEPHIPRGVIDDVGLECAEGEVLQVNLRIGGSAIAIRAAEVIEHHYDYFAFCDFADAALVFPDAADVGRTQFGELMSWR